MFVLGLENKTYQENKKVINEINEDYEVISEDYIYLLDDDNYEEFITQNVDEENSNNFSSFDSLLVPNADHVS